MQNDADSSLPTTQKVKKSKRAKTPGEGKAARNGPKYPYKRRNMMWKAENIKDEDANGEPQNGVDNDMDQNDVVKPKTRRKRQVKNGSSTKPETANSLSKGRAKSLDNRSKSPKRKPIEDDP